VPGSVEKNKLLAPQARAQQSGARLKICSGQRVAPKATPRPTPGVANGCMRGFGLQATKQTFLTIAGFERII
jgi:hypothetical protein